MQMPNEIKINDKFKPLFNRPHGVDTYVITGGRFSSKSYTAAIAAVYWADELGHRILYARYTNVSGKDSVIPEVEEKIKLLGKEDKFDISLNRMESKVNDSKIVFKGLKAGSNTQTANLKSLKDFSCIIFEEAEEIISFDSYEKVVLSIRGNTLGASEPNIKVLILNPTTKQHWIYDEFFASRGIDGGFNGVSGNVCYIHTSYLDCLEFVPIDIITAFELMKLRRPERYNSVVMGGWLDKADGVIFDYTLGYAPKDIDTTLYGMDWGMFPDPTTLIQVDVDKKNKRLYLTGHCYETGMLTNDISSLISRVVGNNLIVGDSAEPRLILELQNIGHNIIGAVKGSGSIIEGITLLKDWDLIINPESLELIKEADNYAWSDKKSGVPIDKWNHYFDPTRYCVSYYLQGRGTYNVL